jgi:hypothetical protein
MAELTHWLVAAAVALGCSRVQEPAGERRSTAPATIARSGAPTPPSPAPAAPMQLLTLPSSAYQASIFVDGDAIELLTNGAAYRLQSGEAPQQRTLDLGFAAAVNRRSYVYWSKAALWSAPRAAPASTTPTRLIALPEPPQRIVADIAGDALAWLERSAGDRYALATLRDRRIERLYTSTGSIDAVTMAGDALYFVERPSAAGFRIGRVTLADGEATFTSVKSGRSPAMLGAGRDIVYYDGSRREVRALSRDLERERVLATDFICSPLAAVIDVYCAGVEGIHELSAAGAPRLLVTPSSGVVTSLAVGAERLAFVADVGERGQDRLAVRVVPLTPSAAAPH